ncbi:Psathyrella Velutina lectin At 1.5a resolution [Panaeolus papilionaceus]|nr:Psathyrella Velutina lectin At 1.5a resolution [Panaeolus papilionaceus]
MSNDDVVISQAQPVPTKPTGIADIVGFGSDGVIILRNSVFLQLYSVLHDFGHNAGNWRVDRHVRLLADTTGNKALDIVGFGEAGVIIAVNKGNNSFEPGKLVLRDFAIGAGGWHVNRHIRFMADIRNTGRADIVGFSTAGVLISENNGNLSFSNASLRLKDFGWNQGWRLDRHLRFLADITGDGLLDIVGFGESNVLVAVNAGNGRFNATKAVVNDMCFSAGGWRIDKHPRLVADLTGDKRADLIGFGDAGVYVALNKGDGTFNAPKLGLNNFGYNAGGWRVEKHPRVLADVNGNGLPDIVGFGENGVWVAINNGNGTFQPAKMVLDNFAYSAGGWRVEKHLRFAVDLTGDGRADIVGFGENSVWVSYNDGKGNFGPVTKLVDNFTVGQGWTKTDTVRFVANLYA